MSPWSLHLSTLYDVLGPFPQCAREQQFLSPSFPLDLNKPIDLSKSWPSSYSDGGSVSWSTASSNESGDLQISFPNIRWSNLLETEGWAALQHHAILRSKFTIHPPPQGSQPSNPPTHVLVHLTQASYFTIIPSDRSNFTQEWYAGNIYALPRVSPRHVPLPVIPDSNQPTTYELWVAGEYEIRLFGRSNNPTQSLNVRICLADPYPDPPLLHVKDRDIVPDFVDGTPFGDAIGVAIQNNHPHGWLTVLGIQHGEGTQDALSLELPNNESILLAPTQTRTIPITISHHASYKGDTITFVLLASMEFSNAEAVIVYGLYISLPISHHTTLGQTLHSNWSSIPQVKGTHFYAGSMPSIYYAIPPSLNTRHEIEQPVILALHGAGVDILTMPFWTKALPRNPDSWIVTPTGRTSWGLDWHGPSLISSLEAVLALQNTLMAHDWDRIDSQKILVMGHSNGGQGAWYMAARWPDRVVAAVPAAAYLKSQQYVPLIHARSTHYIDPTLAAILDSSFTPDDNDLHISNLVDTPILAIHGGNDDNVPTFHSREAVSILKTWNPNANVRLKEDPGELHWYDAVLDNQEVVDFIQTSLIPQQPAAARWTRFTLTVSIPEYQGSLHGLRVLELDIPGRLGRVRVEKASEEIGSVYTTNIHSFSMNKTLCPFTINIIDDQEVEIPGSIDIVTFIHRECSKWEVSTQESIPTDPPSTRIQSILSSPGPIRFIIDETNPSSLSAALRLAVDLDVHHELDVDIIPSTMQDTLSDTFLPKGNLVFLGPSEYASSILKQGKTPFTLSETGILSVNGRKLDSPGIGALFMHPHPSGDVKQQALFIHSTDAAGMERALRLFPIRTGIPVPAWIVTSKRADQVGAAGVIGAGIWTRDWKWSKCMTWLC